MMKDKIKSFQNNGENGIYLKFPNGIEISTIWGYCNYCENYNKPTDDKHGFGNTNSNDVEVMIMRGLSRKKVNYISKKLSGYASNPFGYITIEKWLMLLNYCNKQKAYAQTTRDAR